MYYLFDKWQIEEEGLNLEELIQNGIVKDFSEGYVSGTEENLIYNGVQIHHLNDLYNYIYGYDGGEYFKIGDGLEITKETVLENLVELMLTEEDEERIINAENPTDVVEEMINKAIAFTIVEKKQDIIDELDKALQLLNDGKFEWK